MERQCVATQARPAQHPVQSRVSQAEGRQDDKAGHPASPASLSSLPAELVSHIADALVPSLPEDGAFLSTAFPFVDYNRRVQGLWSLCLVSRRMFPFAFPRLYHVAAIRTIRALLCFLRSLIRHPGIQPMVRSIYVGLDWGAVDACEVSRTRQDIVDATWAGFGKGRELILGGGHAGLLWGWLRSSLLDDRTWAAVAASLAVHFATHVEHVTLAMPSQERFSFDSVLFSHVASWAWLCEDSPVMDARTVFLRNRYSRAIKRELFDRYHESPYRYQDPFPCLSRQTLQFVSRHGRGVVVLELHKPKKHPPTRIFTKPIACLLWPRSVSITVSGNVNSILDTLHGLKRARLHNLERLDIRCDQVTTLTPEAETAALAAVSDRNLDLLLHIARRSLKELHLNLLVDDATSRYIISHRFSPTTAMAAGLPTLDRLEHVTAMTLTLNAAFGSLVHLEARVNAFDETNPTETPLLAGFPPRLVRLDLLEWWEHWVRYPSSVIDGDALRSCRGSDVVKCLVVLLPHNVRDALPDLKMVALVATSEEAAFYRPVGSHWLLSGRMGPWQMRFRDEGIAFETRLRFVADNALPTTPSSFDIEMGGCEGFGG